MIPWIDPKYTALHLFGPFQLGSVTIPDITIHAFGVLVVTGILTGSHLTHKRGRQLGLKDEMIASMISHSLIVGFLFSHVFDVFAYQTKGPNPSLWEIINPFGGLSSYGGFIGAVAGMIYFCKKNKQPIMPYADSLAFGLATGWFFGRLGCFTAHDHPGHLTDFFLAVKYPEGARHDLGLDEAIWSFFVASLFLLMARKNRPCGIYLAILTSAYAPVRLGLDFLRATDTPGADPRYLGLTPAQYGCIGVLVIGVLVFRWTFQHAKSDPAPA